MKIIFKKFEIFLLLIAGLLAGCRNDNPPPSAYSQGSVPANRGIIMSAGITNIRVLNQNWSSNDALTFYSLPQGSHFLNYKLFVNLEQAASTNLFLDPSNILALGYLPRKADNANLDGLPLGFVKDEGYVGLTCAACHTGYITHGNTAYLIDGGPTLGDGEMLMRGIEQALKATQNDSAKFDRLADRAGWSRDVLKANLMDAITIRSAYNARNLPGPNQPRFGPGRIDAFGGILNEVAVRFAEFPNNSTEVNAPVSYPCLWDTPQHDRVQWNGFASNDRCKLVGLAVGTEDYGALGRNVGEVVGVFADVDTAPDPGLLRGYQSSVNKPNLILLENTIKKLWSPQWPSEFGAIDPVLKASGQALYQKNCVSCHDDKFIRTDENRTVTAVMANVQTDTNMAYNVAHRTGNAGILKGRVILKFPTQELGETASLGDMLEHIGQRVVLGDHLDVTNVDAPSIYSVQAVIPLNGAVLTGDFSQLKFENHKLVAARAVRKSLVLKEFGREAIKLNKPSDFSLASASVVNQFSPKPATTDERILASWRSYSKIAAFQVSLADLERKRTNAIMNMIAITSTDEGAWTKQMANLEATITTNVAELAAKDVESTNNIPYLLDFSAQNITESDVQLTYKARPLNGIWATAPYLHNGSVPNLDELLKESDPNAMEPRVQQFHVGSHEFDVAHVGFQTTTGDYIFDTTAKFGNSNAGHDYASGTYKKIFTPVERAQLIEYLKSL